MKIECGVVIFFDFHFDCFLNDSRWFLCLKSKTFQRNMGIKRLSAI